MSDQPFYYSERQKFGRRSPQRHIQIKHIQFIERDGKREYAVMPMHLFERIAPMFKDLNDEALFDMAQSRDDAFRAPAAVVQAIVGGISPVKAWRESPVDPGGPRGDCWHQQGLP